MRMKAFLWMLTLMLIISSAAAAQAATWETPCIEAPYDWTYQDEMRAISIKKIGMDQSVCYAVDVQIREVSAFHAGLAQGDLKRCPLWRSVQGRCWPSMRMTTVPISMA